MDLIELQILREVLGLPSDATPEDIIGRAQVLVEGERRRLAEDVARDRLRGIFPAQSIGQD